jgi:hypothetical protein
MDKNIIKKHLVNKFVNEAETPGIAVTNAAKKESEKINKQAVKDVDKNLASYEKNLNKGMEATDVNNKFNYNGDKEKEYHDQMEIMNGQEMIQYDRDPNKEFKDRAKEAIEGSSRMGNNPDWANVIPAQQGFTGPEFGKNLVKNAEDSFKKRMDAQTGIMSFGDDIEVVPKGNQPMGVHSALAENKDNNKTQIKEGMKRLKFKKEFNGVGNALKMIPESYRVDNKVFEMTDGVENYKIRWEGSLTEGKAVVLMAADKTMVNEDMQKMKHLMGYKSQETLGTVKGRARLDENSTFNDIWKKTKMLMEMEDIEDADAKEGNWDEINVPQAADAKKHVEGSVASEKKTEAPNPKTGEFEKIKKHAAEATKHVTMKESVEEEEVVKEEEEVKEETTKSTETTSKGGKNIEDVTAKEGNWDEINVPQAADAKKHIHMGKETTAKVETEAKENEEGLSEGVVIGGIKFEPINESWMEEGMYEEGEMNEAAMYEDMMNEGMGKIKVAFNDFRSLINDKLRTAFGKIAGNERAELYSIIDDLISTFDNPGNQDSGKMRVLVDKLKQVMNDINSKQPDAAQNMGTQNMGADTGMAMNEDAVQSIEVGAEKVADKIESILSPEEVNFLVQAYQQGGKEMVANALNQSVNEGLPEPPAEGDYGMSQSELKLRQISQRL